MIDRHFAQTCICIAWMLVEVIFLIQRKSFGLELLSRQMFETKAGKRPVWSPCKAAKTSFNRECV